MKNHISCKSNTSIKEEGTVKFKNGDWIRNKRYKVLKMSGKGTFGTVLEVFDYKHKEKVALKVIRSVKRYLDAAYVEVNILEKIRKADKIKKSFCVRLFGAFTTRIRDQKHVCLAFEKLGMNIYEFIKTNNYRGFEIETVSKIGKQLIYSISFLHSIKLTHTDLKPENILFTTDKYLKFNHKILGRNYCCPESSNIRIIDFGGATFKEDHHSKIINTRQYRAPEVILGIGWNELNDIWSLGCIMSELYTGELLFGTHEDIEHLALMEKILNHKIPRNLAKKSIRLSKYIEKKRKSKKRKKIRFSSFPFNQIFSLKKYRLKYPQPKHSRRSIEHVNSSKNLMNLIFDIDLVDFIGKCLIYDSRLRVNANTLERHKFLHKYNK